MAGSIQRTGYGQGEPNHLSAQYTGQIYAQLPAQSSAGTATAQLENGQYLKYNYAGGRAHTDGDGEWMLVYNEEKLYDERRQSHKDFAMIASEQADGKIYPRLFKTNVGDIYTTNTFGTAATGPDFVQSNAVSLTLGNYVAPNSATGWLEKVNSLPASGMAWQVVKETTMPDGTVGVKIQRVQ